MLVSQINRKLSKHATKCLITFTDLFTGMFKNLHIKLKKEAVRSYNSAIK